MILDPLKSQAFDAVTMLRCLLEISNTLQVKPKWEGKTPEQNLMLKWLKRYGDAIMKLPDLLVKTSTSAEVLNRWFREHKFSIQFSPFNELSGEFGAGAILKRKNVWVIRGAESKKPIRYESRLHQAFVIRHNEKAQNIQFLKVPGYSNPVAVLKTQSGDRMLVTIADRPLQGPNLLEQTHEIAQNLPSGTELNYQGIVMPDTTMNISPDMNFMIGLKTYDNKKKDWYIGQAIQQVIAIIDRNGFEIRIVSGASAERGGTSPKPRLLVINEPFLACTLDKDGLGLPISALYSAPDSWALSKGRGVKVAKAVVTRRGGAMRAGRRR